MRLVTFDAGSGARAGAILADGTRIVDLASADEGIPQTVLGVLRAGPDMHSRVAAVIAEPDPKAIHDLASVRLHAPVPVPGAILCIGYNYRGHNAKGKTERPEYPEVFAKMGNTIIGSDDAILLPRASDQIDYEGELGVVIGRTAAGVSEADALSYVAGYTVFNDVSARDVQNRGSQWILGKSFDTFGPMGPALVTADEVPDPQNLDITVRSNDNITVRSTTADMVFPVAYLISYLSSIITLQPGDLIATGSPARTPDIGEVDRFMQAGDTVSITFGSLGTLVNRVQGPPT